MQRRRKKIDFELTKNPHHGMTRRTSQKQDCWEVIKGPLFSRKVPKFFLFPFPSFHYGHHNFYPCRFTAADCNVQCIWVSSPDSLRPKKSEMRFWLLPSSRLQKAGGPLQRLLHDRQSGDWHHGRLAGVQWNLIWMFVSFSFFNVDKYHIVSFLPSVTGYGL